MREAAFIQRNQTKWQHLEQVVKGLNKLTGDEASDLYVQLNDDLAYAQTFYPKSKITIYLNGLLLRLHQHIYRNQRTPRKRFITFWTQEVPLAAAQARKNLLFSFITFALAALLGAVSAEHDLTFVRLVIPNGDQYVDMTLENIKNGKAMDVYASADEGEMFLMITTNNIKVSLLCFVLGIFASFGSALMLLQNGVMVGAFQYFFYQHGVLEVSALTLWVHGTLEISAIIIAGGAGYCLGNGFLFPGTLTRGESFRRGAKTGLKVVIGLIPVFIVAGFLESFVTRHAPVLNTWVCLTIILGSLAWIIYYFIILPYHAERRAHPVAPSA
ncbi:MAG TPA: stage II sporulation protein M [Flavobacteriales bacterium]|nr:stage II sporulation protein M [Flavobacteriales bacterium]